MKTLYTAAATATGGRTGHAESSDGALAVALTVPQEMGGTGAAGTNPEQLFAAGYAACFGSALDYLAKQRKIDIGGSARHRRHRHRPERHRQLFAVGGAEGRSPKPQPVGRRSVGRRRTSSLSLL